MPFTSMPGLQNIKTSSSRTSLTRRDAKHGKGRGGSIVMTASLAGYLASAGAPLYSAAKHGIVGLMRALKNDLATVNIAISVVAPGITVTPILSQERIDIKAGGIDEVCRSWGSRSTRRRPLLW